MSNSCNVYLGESLETALKDISHHIENLELTLVGNTIERLASGLYKKHWDDNMNPIDMKMLASDCIEAAEVFAIAFATWELPK